MIFIVYIILLSAILWLTRKKEDKEQSSVIFAFNYCVVTAIYFIQQADNYIGLPEKFRLFVISMTQAPFFLGFKPQVFITTTDIWQFLVLTVVALCTVRLALALFFKRTLIRIQYGFKMLFAKEVIILKGKSEDVYALANDIREKHREAVVCFIPSPDEKIIKQPAENCLLINEKYTEDISNNKEITFVLLPDKYNNNIIELKKLNEYGKNHSNVRVTAFLDNDILRQDDLKLDGIDAYLVSRESLIVQRFNESELPLEHLIKKGSVREQDHMMIPTEPYTVFTIGFTKLSQEFLLSMYENTGFFSDTDHRQGMDAYIYDTLIDQRRSEFFEDYPQFRNEKTFQWYHAGSEFSGIYDKIRESGNLTDLIVLDTGDTEKNIDIAMRLLRVYKKEGLISHPLMAVALYDDSKGTLELLSGDDNLLFQQVNKSRFTYENLIERKLDISAKRINDQYRKKSSNTMNWTALGTFTQASNRAVVRDMKNKELLIGDISGCTEEETEEIAWKLAEYEHYRWNRFHFAHGWSVLPTSEMTESEVKKMSTKRPEEKRHICLIPFEELDSLPQKEPGIIKYYDYENVLSFIKELQCQDKD